MLPIFLSMEKKQDEFQSKFQGSDFVLKDVNDSIVTQTSFEGPLTAIFLDLLIVLIYVL